MKIIAAIIAGIFAAVVLSFLGDLMVDALDIPVYEYWDIDSSGDLVEYSSIGALHTAIGWLSIGIACYVWAFFNAKDPKVQELEADRVTRRSERQEMEHTIMEPYKNFLLFWVPPFVLVSNMLLGHAVSDIDFFGATFIWNICQIIIMILAFLLSKKSVEKKRDQAMLSIEKT